MKLNDEVKYKHSKTGIVWEVVAINGSSMLLSPFFSDIRIKAEVDEVKKVGSAGKIKREATRFPSGGRWDTKQGI